jgi:hypothetical protein
MSLHHTPNPYRTVAVQGDTPCHIGYAYVHGTDESNRVGNLTKELLRGWLAEEYGTMLHTHTTRNGPFFVDFKRINLAEPSLLEMDAVFTIGYKPLEVFIGGSKSTIFSHADNLRFRAVHDWHHWQARGEFDFAGEFKTFKHSVKRLKAYSEANSYPASVLSQAASVLYSEIVLQVAAYDILGGFPAEQKIILCPVDCFL